MATATNVVLQQNNAFDDSSFFIVNPTDNSKAIRFDVPDSNSGTVVVTMPSDHTTIGGVTSIAADNITEGDAAVTIKTTSGAINIGHAVNNEAINIGSGGTGAITIGHDTSTKVDINAAIIELDSAGAIDLNGSGDIGLNSGSDINLSSSNMTLGTTDDFDLTSAYSITLKSTSGITNGADAAGAILLSAVDGGIGLAWNDSKDLWAEGGKFIVTANENAAHCIKLHADTGTSQTITIVNDEGTDAGAINLTATAGGITLSGPKKGTNVDGTYFFAISNDTNQTTPVLYSFSAVAQKAYYIEVHVCCYNTTGNTSFSYIVKSLIQRDATSNTAVIGTNSAETRGTLDGTVTVVTDDTNEEIDVVLTPGSTNELKWRGTIKIISNDTPTSTAE